MTTFAKKIIAIVLALCLGMSMGLQAFAATTVVESEPEITVEGGITTVVKTTTEITPQLCFDYLENFGFTTAQAAK